MNLYHDHRSAVTKDTGSCSRKLLALTAGGVQYELHWSPGTFSLVPADLEDNGPGVVSFIEPDEFVPGVIGEADARRILAGAVPVRQARARRWPLARRDSRRIRP